MSKERNHTDPSAHSKKEPLLRAKPKHPAESGKPPSRWFLVFSWLLVAIMLGIIFFMSSRSGEMLDTSSGIITIVRNALLAASSALFGHPVDVSPIGHFAEYFLLGAALTNALRLSLPLPKACAYAVFFASLYGVSDELHQLFVPGRSCDPADWLVDTLAALIASLIFAALFHARQKRKNSPTQN